MVILILFVGLPRPLSHLPASYQNEVFRCGGGGGYSGERTKYTVIKTTTVDEVRETTTYFISTIFGSKIHVKHKDK